MINKPQRVLAVFEGKKIRRFWDTTHEKWFFSVVDVVAALTASVDPAAYWRKLKERLKKEGANETVTKCHGLKMLASDGKMRLTDTADTETMLRLMQSIPSPNAEPFKQWLAWAGMNTRDYKSFKSLKKENLRDNMSNLELVLNMLAETATTEISQKRQPKDFQENQKVAREGGGIAGSARRQIEAKTGKRVVSSKNHLVTRRTNVLQGGGNDG